MKSDKSLFFCAKYKLSKPFTAVLSTYCCSSTTDFLNVQQSTESALLQTCHGLFCNRKNKSDSE